VNEAEDAPSAKLDDKPDEDAAKGKDGDRDQGHLEPVDGCSGFRFAVDPFVPCPVGLGTRAVVMPKRTAEAGFFVFWRMMFHDKQRARQRLADFR
jgi:hypothetical protein